MSPAAQCPQCGAILPDGLQGLCPRCLGREAAGILAARTGATAVGSPPANPHTRLRYFGDYELLEEIARGGMGVVWKARQLSLNRLVAVKMLQFGPFARDEFRRRFEAEAQAAANLQHPNIVAIHEVGEHEGQPYLSMDYVEGGNLANLARTTPLPPKRAAALVQTVALAVHYAHQRGVIHRDLKPSNVLLDAHGQPRVTDFGLAKWVAPDSKSEIQNQKSEMDVTLSGQVLGTPGFMPPEQAGGRRGTVGPTSDVYSLGALLYFLLTERAPFATGTLEETLRQVCESEPVGPRLLNPAVPRDLETICLKCLSKEPRRRYPSAQALADELERYLDDEPILARPARAPEKLWRWCCRKPALAASLGAVFLLLLTLAIGSSISLLRIGRARAGMVQAQRETTTNLWNSYLAQARANRYSGRPGRRFDSLAAVAKAAAIRPAPELRDEAIAALALFDVRPIKQAWAWTNMPKWMSSVPDTLLERYAIGHTNGDVTVHRMANDVELMRLPAGETTVARVFAFSPAGRFLAVYVFSTNATMRVWDLESRAVALTAQCLESGLSLDFSPDNRSVAMVDGTDQVLIHDLASGVRHSLPAASRLSAVRYSPDGRILAVTSRDYGKVSFLDADSGRVLATRSFDYLVSTLAWHPDGKLVATDYPLFRIQVWNWQTGEVLQTLGQHTEITYFRAFHPKGNLLFSCGWDGTRVWNFRSGEQLRRIPGAVSSLRFRPDGSRLFAQRPANAEFRIFEVALDDPVRRIDPDSNVHQLTGLAAFSPDGALFLNTSDDGFLFIHDVQTGRTLAEMETGRILGIAFDAGTNLWTSGARGLLCWPLRHDAVSHSWTLGPPTSIGDPGEHGALSISHDGLTVANAESNRCHLFDALARTELRTLAPGNRRWDYIALAPDGATLVTGNFGSFRMPIWETQNGKCLHVLGRNDFTDAGPNMVFSPDGRWMAVSTRDEISVWRTTDWTAAWRIPNDDHGPPPAISPQSGVLAVRCEKTEVRLFALESGRLLTRFELPTGEPLAPFYFSPDGTRLALRGTLTRTIFILDLRRIRERLAAMNLDWDMPPYPPEPTPPRLEAPPIFKVIEQTAAAAK